MSENFDICGGNGQTGRENDAVFLNKSTQPRLMESVETVSAQGRGSAFLSHRARALAANAVKRGLAGKGLSQQTCRRCGEVVECREYEFKARRHFRMAGPRGLGANTTWIMAKHDEMIPGRGGICARCMELILQERFAHTMKRLLPLGLALCVPFPVWLMIQHRSWHEMSDNAFLASCLTGILFWLGLMCAGAAWSADHLLSYKFNQMILARVAWLERAALRERFPADKYALQIGLRFCDQDETSEEVVSSDDCPTAAPDAANL